MADYEDDADIRRFEKMNREIDRQPRDIRSMTHRPQAPKRDVVLDLPLGLEARFPKDYRVAPAMDTLVNGLYGLGSMGLYATPLAPVQGAIDFADGLYEGDPTDVAMSAFGVRSKAAKRALAGAAGAMTAMSTGEAQASPEERALMDYVRGLPKKAGGGIIRKGVKAAKELAAPAVKRGTQLFDYEGLDEVPNVPQFDLERTVPPRGVSARVQELTANKDVTKQVEDIVDAGIRKGGPAWYNTDQLRQRFVGELGEKAGNMAFRRYMDYVAGSSPRSKVDANARNASFYYMLDRQGLPLPEKNPYPYGHMAQKLHRENAMGIREDDGWDVFRNPKPASFVENLIGNQMPVTVDAHALKLPAMLSRDPRFLATSYQWKGKDADGNKVVHKFKPRQMFKDGEINMDDAIARPAFFDSQPNANEYGAMEQFYKEIGQRKGLTPAQTQASAWVGGGHLTDLGSPSDPFLKVFEDRVQATAAKTGKSPEEVLRDFIRGNVSLYRKGGKVSAQYEDC